MPGGGYIYLLGCFGLLLGLSKLVEKGKLHFIWAGAWYALLSTLLLVAPLFIGQLIVGVEPGNVFMSIAAQWWHLLISFVVASIVLRLLDWQSDTIANWLIAFTVGYLILAFVVP